MMKEIIVESEEAATLAIEKYAKIGLQIACISNAGLPSPKKRLTFLPESCFIKDDVAIKSDAK